jgi:hypothetical protein
VNKLIAVLGCFAALTLAACAAPAGPGPVAPAASLPAGRIHYALTRQLSEGVPLAGAFVTYDNGPVLVDPKIYLIFWGYKTYGDPDKVENLLKLYTSSMGGSAHNNIYTQYYEISDSKKIFITNPANQLGGVWDDEAAVPKTPTDAQIAAVAVNSIAHFGYDANAIYAVMTPHDHSEVGFGTHWCSYHSYTTYESDEIVAYANLPYMPDAGSACGNDFIAPPSDESGVDEGVTILAGHEYGEAITDPQPFTGWNGVSGEIGDYCAWHNIANEKFGKKSYTTQPMLSDATESCVQTYK